MKLLTDIIWSYFVKEKYFFDLEKNKHKLEEAI